MSVRARATALGFRLHDREQLALAEAVRSEDHDPPLATKRAQLSVRVGRLSEDAIEAVEALLARLGA